MTDHNAAGFHLAVEVGSFGAHPAARRPGGIGELAQEPPDRAARVGDLLAEQVAAVEAAGFALVTIDDSPGPEPAGRIEAGARAGFLARRTSRIGLAPALDVTVTEPFHLATQLASLDHASLGRGGWVVGAGNSPGAYATSGARPLTGPRLSRKIAEVIEVARRLWDSWQDDAVIRDRATGRFPGSDRGHHVDFAGSAFSVAGPLIMPRPPQGQLVVLGADTLGVTGHLDVALIGTADLEELTERVSRARSQGAPLVFAELEVLLGEDRLPALDAVTPWGPPRRLRHVGDAATLRDGIDRLAGLVDGVRLHPAEPAVDLPRLADALRLQPPAAGTTLRETLGLPRPANRFATAR